MSCNKFSFLLFKVYWIGLALLIIFPGRAEAFCIYNKTSKTITVEQLTTRMGDKIASKLIQGLDFAARNCKNPPKGSKKNNKQKDKKKGKQKEKRKERQMYARGCVPHQ